MPVPDGPLRATDVLASFSADAPSLESRIEAFIAIEPELARAASAAVATSPERATTVADALSGTLLAPFARPGEEIPEPLAKRARDAMADLEKAVMPGFVALVHHPDVEMRTKAIEVLARRADPQATTALIDALGDPDDRVRRAALSAFASSSEDESASSPLAAEAIIALAKTSPDWALRVRAAEALGRVGTGAQKDRAFAALSVVAKGDSYALVREAAVRALFVVDAVASESILRELSQKDGEPRVREAAAALLSRKKP